MKKSAQNLLLACVLLTILGSVRVVQLSAQTFSTLYSFSGGSDGAGPRCGLALSGSTLYGTTSALLPGSSGNGTVFALNSDGTGFTALYNFTGGSDGANPYETLLLLGNTLYGTATAGGSSGRGTVFSLSVDGTGFRALYNFTGGSDGAFPRGELVWSGSALYGAAEGAGDAGSGTVFTVNTNGMGLADPYSFTAIRTNSLGAYGNSDGALPSGGVILSTNTLFGTAAYGGSSNSGTVFKVNTDGTGFTTLHSFTTGSDGAQPVAGLLLASNTLFGTTYGTGIAPTLGTVFALNTDGTGFKTLHRFTASIGSDGCCPMAGLILSGSTLYGTASGGGASRNGAVFKINTDGTGFQILHSFSGGDGNGPRGRLTLLRNTLYGTTYGGGNYGYGTIFSISLPVSPPLLRISPAGGNVVLSWPTNATGFTLQSTTNLCSPVWIANLSAPVVVTGQNTVTNPVAGTHQFYRLISNGANPSK